MNIRFINIAEKNESIQKLEQIKNKNYGNLDIRIFNLHLIKLNVLIGRNVFKKNDGYISAETLFDVMQESNGRNKHHHHSLSTEDVYKGLRYLNDPICIIEEGNDRFLTVSSFLSSLNVPILVVVEINAALVIDIDKRINKIITMFPSDKMETYIKKLIEGGTLLYKK